MQKGALQAAHLGLNSNSHMKVAGRSPLVPGFTVALYKSQLSTIASHRDVSKHIKKQTTEPKRAHDCVASVEPLMLCPCALSLRVSMCLPASLMTCLKLAFAHAPRKLLRTRTYLYDLAEAKLLKAEIRLCSQASAGGREASLICRTRAAVSNASLAESS